MTDLARTLAAEPSRPLALATLVARGACINQRDLFRKRWGDSVEVTVALCQSVADQVDWAWAGEHLLTAPARAEYERVTAPAWAEYERVTAPARAEYERGTAAAWAEYERGTAAAWAEYDRVTAPARAEYERVTAAAWAGLYIAEAQS